MDLLSLFIIPFYIPFIIFTIGRCIFSVAKVAFNKELLQKESHTIVFTETHTTILIPLLSYIQWHLFNRFYDVPYSHLTFISFFVSIASFWTSKLFRINVPTPIRYLLRCIILMGLGLCLLSTMYTLQMLQQQLYYPFFGFELLTSIANIFLLSRETYFNLLWQRLCLKDLPLAR